MDVTKIGGQKWQSSFGIFAGAVPSQQRHYRKAVSKVVDARPIAI
jgi:hypothetical protein